MSNIVKESEIFWAREKENIPEKAVSLIESGIEFMESDAFNVSPLNEGDSAPPFSLHTHNGDIVASEDLYQNNTVVLFFYRGEWCPFCNLQLKAYMDQRDEFNAKGASLVAVSPETPDYSMKTFEKSGVSFDILHDENNSLASGFGIVAEVPKDHVDALAVFDIDLSERHASDSVELPVPSVFVVKDGVITFRFFDYNYRVRAEVEDILNVL